MMNSITGISIKNLTLAWTGGCLLAFTLTTPSFGQATRQSPQTINNPPANGATYPYLAGHNLEAASQIYVDPLDSRTGAFSYSPYLGREHGNLYYRAEGMRKLVDDRPHIATTEPSYQVRFANRRSGARQLDAQNRRSGYRIIGPTENLVPRTIIIEQPMQTIFYRYGTQVQQQFVAPRTQQQRYIQTQPRYIQAQPGYIQAQPRYIQAQP